MTCARFFGVGSRFFGVGTRLSFARLVFPFAESACMRGCTFCFFGMGTMLVGACVFRFFGAGMMLTGACFRGRGVMIVSLGSTYPWDSKGKIKKVGI